MRSLMARPASGWHGLVFGVVLLTLGVPAAQAITIDLASLPNGDIVFDPADGSGSEGSFSFDTDTAGDNFHVTSLGGLKGSLTGDFEIGTVTAGSSTSPLVLDYASVTGTGDITISDGAGGNLTAKVMFNQIYTLNGTGGIFTSGEGNLTSITYSGSNPTLQTMYNAGSATQTISFNILGVTLSDLVDETATVTRSSSWSSTITAVPIPAAAWLFGSALLGITMLGRRKQSKKSLLAEASTTPG